MNTQIYLVTGGARSGKSTFAQKLAANLGKTVVYIATAEAGDPEMADRIKKHQSSRPSSWKTVESPLNLADAIFSYGETTDVLLIDCITLFISNLIFKEVGIVGETENPDFDPKIEENINAAVLKVMDAAKNVPATVIFVTNEVGAGLVPSFQLGRLYRDVVGRANRQIADVAKQVFWLTCGIPIDLKSCAYTFPSD